MKYTLHIALDEKVGDLVIRTYQRVKKFGQQEAPCFVPLLFTEEGRDLAVRRPEISYPIADVLVHGAEVCYGAYFSWATKNKSKIFKSDEAITAYLEKIYLDNITVDSGYDPEMHIVFYVPLYDKEKLTVVNRIIACLPLEYRFVVNIVAISYDVAEAVKLIKEPIKRDERNAYMKSVMSELVAMHDTEKCSHIIFFQNRNVNGLSVDYDKDKLVSTLADVAINLIGYYDEIVKYIEDHRPIFTINSQSYVLDIYHLINSWLRDMFLNEASQYIVDYEDETAESKADEIFDRILKREQKVIKDFIATLDLYNHEYSVDELQKLFDENCLRKIDDIIREESADASVTVKLFLYKKFRNISSVGDINSDTEMADAIRLDGLLVDNLPMDENVADAYKRLEQCLKGIKAIKLQINKTESEVEALKRQISDSDYQILDHDSDGLKFGNTIYKSMSQGNHPLSETYIPSDGEMLPKSVDLRPQFTSVKNQGEQGACSAFTMVSVYEYFIRRMYGDSVDLSEAYVYYNSRLQSGNTAIDCGANFNDTLQAVSDNGFCVESLCPYDVKIFDKEPSQASYNDGKSRLVTEAKNVRIDISHIKSVLAKGLPVIISVKSIDTLRRNANGVISIDDTVELNESYHAMVVCGYSDAEGYFIVRNSWGKEYGDKGYCYFPYSFFRNDEIIKNCFAVTGINDHEFSKIEKSINDSTIIIGNNPSAQYEISKNILSEKILKLNEEKAQLVNSRNEYLKLCRELGEKELSEFEIDAIDTQIEEIKNKQKGNKSLIKRLFGKEEIEENELQQLIFRRNSYLVNSIVSNGIIKQNLSYFEEYNNIIDRDMVISEESARIKEAVLNDKRSYFRRISPASLNLDKEIAVALEDEAIKAALIDAKDALVNIVKRKVGVYELYEEVLRMVSEYVLKNTKLTIADFLDDKNGEAFFEHINESCVNTILNGWVHNGLGEDVIHLSAPIELKTSKIKLSSNVNYIMSADPYRMTFLHIERYDMKHFVIFN